MKISGTASAKGTKNQSTDGSGSLQMSPFIPAVPAFIFNKKLLPGFFILLAARELREAGEQAETLRENGLVLVQRGCFEMGERKGGGKGDDGANDLGFRVVVPLSER